MSPARGWPFIGVIMPQKRLVFTLGEIKELIIENYKDINEVFVFGRDVLEISDSLGNSMSVDDDTFLLEGISNK